ncbi:cyanophycinase [Marivirga harenae]|uniref:cyanophycinase n=1 Tax=Marivirga harenae TaxID=2010992 RepID=UPI0026E00832|nr:cyanophycinase [Marivirga harenae]WKV13839.1 cyanophycinase [Marivirga harenae]
MILSSIFRNLCTVFLFFSILSLHAQGKLMLVGGGGETDGGWSDTPYQWMVDNAVNKTIGIISYSDADNWLPDYFVALGAVEAVNIKIDSRELANQAGMLDSLNQYDALFFKGGDQSRYYDYYKNTAVQNAIEDIYNRGGVIGGTSAGMAILSGVLFTASNGSAYPYDALTDINSQYMTLEDDFLHFYPDYIFDTHFVERGRTSRLIGFLANWYENHGELIKGIGIDDRTAFCIDENGKGIVYGTGAASIYLPQDFQILDGKIINSNVKAIQITHAHSYDLNEERISEWDLANHSEPSVNLPYYQVFASSETILNRNRDMLEEVISTTMLEGKILLISKAANSKVSSYTEFLEENSSSEVVFLDISSSEEQEEQITLRNKIRESSLVLFLEPGDINYYLNFGPTGELLKSHMLRNEITNVFLGDIANQLGVSYADNIYQDPFNAYYDDLEFSDGLAVLPDFNIITEAYGLDDKDYYENISSAVVDRVLSQDLKYGVYLTGSTYFSYTINDENQAIIKMDGELSSVLVENSGTRFAQTDQTVSGSSSRMQYAFDSLNYRITKATAYEIGEVQARDQEEYQFEEEEVLSNIELSDRGIYLLQNPIGDKLKLYKESSYDFNVSILSVDGRSVFNGVLRNNGFSEFNVGYLPNTRYILIVEDALSRNKYLLNIVKTN